jgi:2-haloacid dehalogenase
MAALSISLNVDNDVLGVGSQPQIVGNDLNDVADQLIARHKGRA